MNRPRINIDGLDEAELLDLNRRVVERLKLLRQMHAHLQMMEFRVGDKVQFQPPGRGTLTGMLTRYNRKTVTVITGDGQQWNVAPSLIQRVGAAAPGAATAQADELLLPLARE